MAVNSTFYIDSADFETATAVYLDLALTYIAPDGYYRVGTVVRQQSGGILLAVDTCAECPVPCGTAINGYGSKGVYKINLDVGSLGTGAVLIRFNPASVPDGIRATYNGVVYNKISSPVHGPFQCPNAGHFAIIGVIPSTTGTNCGSWYDEGETQTNDVYLYNPSTLNFEPTGTTQVDVISPAPNEDWFLRSTPSDPVLMGNCWMVIPKPTDTPNNLLIEIIGPCADTGWTFAAFCPTALPSFSSSDMFESPPSCGREIINTYYFAKVHTAADAYIGLYDYVFTDENGEFPLADGFYLTDSSGGPGYKVLEVVDGVVVAITTCT